MTALVEKWRRTRWPDAVIVSDDIVMRSVALALISPSFLEISGFLETNIRKAIPRGKSSDPRDVQRGILERIAFLNSIQIKSERLCILKPSIHFHQTEEIVFQFFFLDQ